MVIWGEAAQVEGIQWGSGVPLLLYIAPQFVHTVSLRRSVPVLKSEWENQSLSLEEDIEVPEPIRDEQSQNGLRPVQHKEASGSGSLLPLPFSHGRSAPVSAASLVCCCPSSSSRLTFPIVLRLVRC